jgi:hypothetical protein
MFDHGCQQVETTLVAGKAQIPVSTDIRQTLLSLATVRTEKCVHLHAVLCVNVCCADSIMYYIMPSVLSGAAVLSAHATPAGDSAIVQWSAVPSPDQGRSAYIEQGITQLLQVRGNGCMTHCQPGTPAVTM